MEKVGIESSAKQLSPKLHTARNRFTCVAEFPSIMAKRNLNFITGNKNKLAEVSAILQDVVDLRSQSVDLVEIQGTIEEISKDKCRRAAEAVCQQASFETGSIFFYYV